MSCQTRSCRTRGPRKKKGSRCPDTAELLVCANLALFPASFPPLLFAPISSFPGGAASADVRPPRASSLRISFPCGVNAGSRHRVGIRPSASSSEVCPSLSELPNPRLGSCLGKQGEGGWQWLLEHSVSNQENDGTRGPWITLFAFFPPFEVRDAKGGRGKVYPEPASASEAGPAMLPHSHKSAFTAY